jgi:hypothetical protein
MNRIDELFKSELKVVNMGLESFYKDLISQRIKVIHMDWRPKAGGNPKMLNLLKRLGR